MSAEWAWAILTISKTLACWAVRAGDVEGVPSDWRRGLGGLAIAALKLERWTESGASRSSAFGQATAGIM